MYYSELSQNQVENLSDLLAYANKPQLDELQEKYNEIVRKRDLENYRNNVLQTIMLSTINIDVIYDWFTNLKENTNNTIVHFEYEKIKGKNKYFTKSIIKNLESLKTDIFNVSPNEFTEPLITNISTKNSEIDMSFVLPAKLQVEEKATFNNSDKKILIQKHAFYFTYVWINPNDNSISISFPPTSEYYSIMGLNNRKHIIHLLTQKIISFLTKILGEIQISNPEWVNKALRDITKEYYYHNNPKIEEELEKVETQKNYIDTHKPEKGLKQYITTLSELFDNDFSIKRIEKALNVAIEKELIAYYELKPCHHQFEVFLHEVSKGTTSFKSKNGVSNNTNKSLPSIETRDIILSILDSGSLKTIGLKYFSKNGKSVPYKFSCKDRWFVLEQTNDAGTSKELVKHVLTEFKQYKGSEGTINKRANP